MPRKWSAIDVRATDDCQHPCLIPIRSQQIRICADCKAELPWLLGERKPVGWGVDRELQKITERS